MQLQISKYCCLVTSSTRGDYRDEDGLLAKHEHYRLHAKFQHAFKLLQVHFYDGWCCLLFVNDVVVIQVAASVVL